jgi:hypothetical protein
MDHQEAVRRGAVEKYLLGEMSPEEREEFEEHFFGCTECAAELKATAAFLDGAKRVFERDPVAKPAAPAPVRNKSRFSWVWRPAVLAPAFSFLLLLIAYQNIIVLPRLDAKLAVTHKPEVLSSLSLIGANSRGGTLPTIRVAPQQPLLLMLDVPSISVADVTCVLLSPSGDVVARVPVRAEAAKDTIGLRIPAAAWLSGDYTLIVQDGSPADHADRQEPASELARYRFSLIATTRDTAP